MVIEAKLALPQVASSRLKPQVPEPNVFADASIRSVPSSANRTNSMPLGPREVTGARAVHRAMLPQLSSTMSLGPRW